MPETTTDIVVDLRQTALLNLRGSARLLDRAADEIERLTGIEKSIAGWSRDLSAFAERAERAEAALREILAVSEPTPAKALLKIGPIAEAALKGDNDA